MIQAQRVERLAWPVKERPTKRYEELAHRQHSCSVLQDSAHREVVACRGGHGTADKAETYWIRSPDLSIGQHLISLEE